jgi:hypothetical protein
MSDRLLEWRWSVEGTTKLLPGVDRKIAEAVRLP